MQASKLDAQTRAEKNLQQSLVRFPCQQLQAPARSPAGALSLPKDWPLVPQQPALLSTLLQHVSPISTNKIDTIEFSACLPQPERQTYTEHERQKALTLLQSLPSNTPPPMDFFHPALRSMTSMERPRPFTLCGSLAKGEWWGAGTRSSAAKASKPGAWGLEGGSLATGFPEQAGRGRRGQRGPARSQRWRHKRTTCCWHRWFLDASCRGKLPRQA